MDPGASAMAAARASTGANKFRRHMQMAPMLSNFAQRPELRELEHVRELLRESEKIFLVNRSFAQQHP